MIYYLTRLAAIPTDADDAAAILAVAASPDAAGLILSTRIAGESARLPDDFDVIADHGETGTGAQALAVRVAALVGCAVAAGLVRWPDRRRALAAREAIRAEADALFGPVGVTFGADGLEIAQRFAGFTTRILSERAATLAPIVRVELGQSLPASVVAYRLCGEAARGAALADFAETMTPAIMPVTFEALAPDV